ncbi:MAG: BON domain-containing protein [Nitrospira sp.]|nr:BON domain-containing protein [Nitrospira sp.]
MLLAMSPLRSPVFLLIAGFLTGCDYLLPNPYTTGAQVVVTAVGTALEERTLGEVGDDLVVKTKILQAFATGAKGLLVNVSADVYQGDVLLTGAVKEAAEDKEAEDLARSVPGVRRVINEIQITEDVGVATTARDIVIEMKIKAAIMAASTTSVVNYRWRSINGTVYLLGVAQSREEYDQVYDAVRGLDEVERLIPYVRIKQKEEPEASRSAPPSPAKPTAPQ